MRWIAVSFILGLCAAYALSGTRPETRETPRYVPPGPGAAAPARPTLVPSQLKFTPPTLDFGDLESNESKTLTATVENPTPSPITVTDTYASCGCLAGELSLKVLPPGGRTELKVKFSAQPGSRPTEYSITMSTDEPSAPRAILPVKAHVKQDYLLDPQTLNFGKMPRGGTKTLTSTLKRLDGQPFRLTLVSASHSEFSFKWEPGPENTWRISTTTAPTQSGQVSEGAAVMVEAGKKMVLPLFVNVEVSGDVLCAPLFVLAEQDADKRAGIFEVEVRRLTPGKLMIESVTEGGKLPLEVTDEESGPGRRKLHIRILTPLPRNFALGDFYIKTNVEEQPLRLPYRVAQRYQGPARDAGGP